MHHDEPTLEQRVEQYSFDVVPCADLFVARLARENRWTLAFANRVLREYRRFLVLSQVAGHAVTPSDAVDQAWHLHLTYSESYWLTLCGSVLGRPLHHHPSRGGPEERNKFIRDYEQILESYERVFGELAPADIWPPSARRFGTDLRFARVNTEENWIVPKPLACLVRARWAENKSSTAWLRRWTPFVVPPFVGLLAVLSAGLAGPEFLFFYLALWSLGLALALAVRNLQRPRDDQPGHELTPYEVAELAGGDVMATRAAITTLVERGTLAYEPTTGLLRVGVDKPLLRHDLEREVFERVTARGAHTLGGLFSEPSSVIPWIRRGLEARGLWQEEPPRTAFILALAAPALAVIRIGIGIARERPVGFLVLLSIAGVAVACRGFWRRSGTTLPGEQRLAALRRDREELRRMPRSELADTGSLPVALSLYGLSLLQPASAGTNGHLLDLGFGAAITSNDKKRDAPSDASHTGAITGGGCGEGGGGGCGGGCGGCGGCG